MSAETVLITGASRGIGLNLTKRFVSGGFRVLATCRAPDRAPELSEFMKGANQMPPFPLDVASDASVQALKQYIEQEKISIAHVINNAGINNKTYPIEDPDKIDRQEMIDIFNTNVVSVGQVTVASGVLRPENKNGKVINISSIMGSIKYTQALGYYNAVSYRTSKAALNMLTACFALQHPHVCFIMMHPGWVQTDMGGAGGRTADLSPDEAVEGIFNVFSTLDLTKTGKFLNWKGEELPY